MKMSTFHVSSSWQRRLRAYSCKLSEKEGISYMFMTHAILSLKVYGLMFVNDIVLQALQNIHL